ncbi:TAXI family TRAP transporter solute-binding subunit [Rhizobium sp. 18065]|uniref:TAXI family TRAP transporter solute-binding subunit n=1 Tax=Rhizobium sp. 18065 TaxID=2681411 RepID=UPI00135B8AA6|nr:TAXI family TRAP transporter solute-binding subunit [Rhizobium sp. 18065]
MRSMAILALALSAIFAGITTASADTIRLCTGSSTGVYFAAGKKIKEMAGNAVSIELVNTEGTIDNMRRTLDLAKSDAESCDAFIGQPDGPAYRGATNRGSLSSLRPVATLHREYLHGLCNKESGVEDIGDLESDPAKYSVAIGPPGSGAWLVWQNLIREDEDYKEIPTTSEDGILALTAVSTGQTTCLIVPAGLGNGTVGEADQTFGDTVALVGANDKDFDDAADMSGKPLYEYAKIPGSAYPKSFDYWNDVKTISWPATVYLSTEKVSREAQTAFATAAARAAPAIKASFGK